MKCTLLLLALVATSVGCSGIRVKTRHDKFTDFSKYESYAWLPSSGVKSEVDRVPSGGLLDSRVINAVNAELLQKGLRHESPDRADLLIGYQAIVRRVRDGFSIDRYFGFSSAWHTSDPEEYARGSLILDIVDRVEERTVWRGSAEGAVNPHAPEGRRRERLREAVAKLLAGFPPSATED